MQKDDKHKIDDEAIEKAIIKTAPLKRGAANPSASPKAKRPLSGYMIFGQKMRPVILKEHPTYTVVQTMQEIGKHWNLLSDAEKAKYSLR